MMPRGRHAVAAELESPIMLDVQTINEMIRSSQSRSTAHVWWMLAGIVLLVACGFALLPIGGEQQPGLLRLVLPWVVLVFMAAMLAWWLARQRAAQQRARTAIESLQLEDLETSEAQMRAWFSRPVNPPSARAQGLLALAALANRQHVYEGAANAFQALADDPHSDPLNRVLARVGLAEAWLRQEDITSAVDLLQNLKQSNLPDFVRARYELVALLREVIMRQNEDAMMAMDERADLFRRQLSVRAGAGYALMAAACDQHGDDEQAGAWWKRATLLVRKARLLSDYPLLEAVSSKHKSMEWPWPAK
jgi:tetratricopeptide (TPR) repeat protein